MVNVYHSHQVIPKSNYTTCEGGIVQTVINRDRVRELYICFIIGQFFVKSLEIKADKSSD